MVIEYQVLIRQINQRDKNDWSSKNAQRTTIDKYIKRDKCDESSRRIKEILHLSEEKRREITIVKVYSSDSKSLTMGNLAQFSSTSLFSGSCQFRRVGTPFNFNLGFVLKVDACKQESKVNNDSNIDHTVYNKKVKNNRQRKVKQNNKESVQEK